YNHKHNQLFQYVSRTNVSSSGSKVRALKADHSRKYCLHAKEQQEKKKKVQYLKSEINKSLYFFTVWNFGILCILSTRWSTSLCH
ncbi:hypothetical protein scyTo_0008059, partial [Scyliorhinus torazame]|nr:hypothetical protein [Scyliorhinus torazame]